MTNSGVPPLRRSCRLVSTACLAVLGLSCEQPVRSPGAMLPTFPSDLGTPRTALEDASTARVTFPLLNGTFTVELRQNGSVIGSITGRYTGVASATNSGRATASLEPQVRRRTGAASGLVDLEAAGTGAFLGEGEFTLSLRLKGNFPGQTNASNILVKISGTSEISCRDGTIVITQTGSGSSSRLGDLQVQLRHEIGSAGCA